jgi:hypothetical protein
MLSVPQKCRAPYDPIASDQSTAALTDFGEALDDSILEARYTRAPMRMTGTRIAALLAWPAWLASLGATASGCNEGAPHAVSPTKAATRGLSVCWYEAVAADQRANRDVRKAIAKQLEAAGYRVIPRDCDLRLSLSYTLEDGAIGLSFRTAQFAVRDRTRAPLLDETFKFGSSEVPIGEPDRLAIVLVNAMNASSKVAAVVPPAPGDAGSGSPPAASPPPGAFDVQAAAKALDEAAGALGPCAGLPGAPGGHVMGHVTVQFASSGAVSLAKVDTPSLAGTDAGACIATRFAQLHIPPFAGAAVTVGRSFDLAPSAPDTR